MFTRNIHVLFIYDIFLQYIINYITYIIDYITLHILLITLHYIHNNNL